MMPGIQEQPTATPRPPRLRRWARRFLLVLGISLVVLGVAGLIADRAIDYACIARPPTLTCEPSIRSQPLAIDGGRRSIGKYWLAQRQGVRYMYLNGDPYTLGYANAQLTGHLVAQQESELIDLVRTAVPSRIKQYLLWKLVQVRNHDLPDYLSDDEKIEILGLSEGHEDPNPELTSWAPLYYRILNYHAAHDLSHAVMDSSLVGCTSFAAWGEATADGHLLIGRNFDFAAARAFDTNKIVTRVEQEGAIGYVSVGWPGMAGVVTGVNDRGIAVAVNGAKSDDEARIGTPICFIIRRVLQSAETLEQAVQIIRDATVFVSDLYLVADANAGRTVVVEKTPRQCRVREPGGDSIVCANHFLTEPLASHERNRNLMAVGTTMDRFARMARLVSGAHGKLSPRVAVDILRDRQGPAERDVGLGNEASINPLIATHSVVIDLSDRVIWVSAGPHQLGRFVPFNVDGFEEPPKREALPADSLLEDEAYERYRMSEQFVKDARGIGTDGNCEETIRLLRKAVALNPSFYRPHLLLGKALLAADRLDEARLELQRARNCYPASGAERRKVERLLREIGS